MIVAFDIDETLLTLTGKPIVDVVNLLKKYKDHGHEIIFITARGVESHQYTKNQLRNIGLDKYADLDRIYYTNGGSKVEYLRKLNVSVFFDDLVDNMIDIINNKHLLKKNFHLYQIIRRGRYYKIFDTENKYYIK